MHTPHDRLFRHVFSDPEQAAGELRSLLPAEVGHHIDWRSLQPVPGTFVDETLSERRSDVLFTARVGEGDVLLYLLLEHQSTPDTLMPLRLLRYMVRIWDEYLQGHPEAKQVPAIVPLVVHHSERGWTAPRRFDQVVDLDDDALAALRSYVPRFELLIDDLSVERDEALQQRVLLPALARLSLLCLKWSSQAEDVVQELRRSADLVQQVAAARNGVAALAAVVSYLLEVSPAGPADLRGVFQALGPKTEVAFMTGAQLLREEGRAQGRAEGEALGRAEGEALGRAEGEALGRAEGEALGRAEGEALAILRILDRRGIALSDVERDRVRSCRELDQLERWLDRVLSVESAAELFA